MKKTGQEEEVCLVVEMRRVTAERKGFKKSGNFGGMYKSLTGEGNNLFWCVCIVWVGSSFGQRYVSCLCNSRPVFFAHMFWLIGILRSTQRRTESLGGT